MLCSTVGMPGFAATPVSCSGPSKERAPLLDAQGPWDTHLRRAFLLASAWVGFLTGAALGGAVTSYFGVWVLLPPALTLLALAVFSRADRALSAGLRHAGEQRFSASDERKLLSAH